jgi:hypothetical protein
VFPVQAGAPILLQPLSTPPGVAAGVARILEFLAVSVAGGESSGFPLSRSCLGVRARAQKAVTSATLGFSLPVRAGRVEAEN